MKKGYDRSSGAGVRLVPAVAGVVLGLFLTACGGGCGAGDTNSGTETDSSTDTGTDTLPVCDDSCEYSNEACLVDADCGANYRCVLGICAKGCTADDECDGDLACGAHGRCEDQAGDPVPAPGDGELPPPEMPADGGPVLSHDQTSVPSAGGTATVILTNTASAPMTYRLESASQAVDYDPTPQLLGPGQNVELSMALDPSALPDEQEFVPARVITNFGNVDWDLVVEDTVSGYYQGTLFMSQVQPLGSAPLAVNLEVGSDGTITGQTFEDGSLLWPRNLEVTGELSEDGQTRIQLVDVVPAAFDQQPDWLSNPLVREVGREFVLWGEVDPATGTIEGIVDEFVYGLAEGPVLVQGSFRLDRAGEPRSASGSVESFDASAVSLPEWSFPAELADACDELGTTYGTVLDLAGLGLCAAITDPSEKQACETDYAAACGACSVDLTAAPCTEENARACARALLDVGRTVSDVVAFGDIAIEIGGSPNDSATKAPEAWLECLDAASPGGNEFPCVDQDVTACAGALARHAFMLSDGTDPESARVLLAHLEGEAETSAMLGFGRMVEAGLAYASPDPLAIGSAADAELAELGLAMDLFSRPLGTFVAPGFDRAILQLGEAEIVEDRGGHDLVNMLALAQHATEVLGTQLRLRQRTDIGDADALRSAAQHAAAWLHAQGALLAHRMTVFGVWDSYGHLGAVDDSLAKLARVTAELQEGNNPLGFSRDYVPMLLSAASDPSATNFEENWTKRSERAVQDYEEAAAAAWQAQQNLQSQQFTAVQAYEAMAEDYDAQLVALCGSDPVNPSLPDLQHCGKEAGEINQLTGLIEVAGLHVKEAQAAINVNKGLIDVERARMEQIALLHADTKTLIKSLQARSLTVITETAESKSLDRIAAAEAECGRISDNAAIDAAATAAGAATDAAAGAGWPPNPAIVIAAAAKAGAEIRAINRRSENACQSVTADAGLGNRMEWMDTLANQKITMFNQEIDNILRDSAFKQQVIDSEAAVKSLALNTAELGLALKEARVEMTLAGSQLAGGFQRAAFVLAARERARRRVQGDPQNPYLNPSFLVLRNELGRNLSVLREHAMRRTYQAARALEYETNRDLLAIEADLFPARSPEELRAFHECLYDIYVDYLEEVGGPQPFVTEVSLREDIFGIIDGAFDPVTGQSISPAEQLREILKSVDNRELDGTVLLRVALPLVGNTLIEPDRCDARVSTVDVKVVGDFLGDNEISVQLRNEGIGSMRRCDASALPREQQIEVYNLGRAQTSIQAGANDFGATAANRGFAGWALSSDEWVLAVPPGTVSPANSDLNLDSISDIVIRFEYRASTLLPDGEKAVLPTCGF